MIFPWFFVVFVLEMPTILFLLLLLFVSFCCMHLYFIFTAVSYQMFFHWCSYWDFWNKPLDSHAFQEPAFSYSILFACWCHMVFIQSLHQVGVPRWLVLVMLEDNLQRCCGKGQVTYDIWLCGHLIPLMVNRQIHFLNCPTMPCCTLSCPILSYLAMLYPVFSYPFLPYPVYPALPYSVLPYPVDIVLPYLALSYTDLPCHFLSCPTLPWFTLSFPTLSYLTLLYPVLSYLTLLYPVLSYLILLYPVLSYLSLLYPVPCATLSFLSCPTLPSPTLYFQTQS